ncbi:MAG: alpha/beta fold hydrolase [Polyangiaceae bacterium]
MTERAYTFGAGKALVGVVSQPEPSRLRAGTPGVILLNAGLVHRVGPYRLHVDLARRLAEHGFLVVRFDQSALGDSEPRQGRATYEERAVLDVGEAMDFLADKYKLSRFVPMGICSGAMNSHRAAVADARVCGAVLIDGYSYRTVPSAMRHYAPKLLSPAAIEGTLRRRLTDLRQVMRGTAPRALGSGEPASAARSRAPVSATEEQPGADAGAIFEQDWPPQATIAAELRQLADRGAEMLFVYTAAEGFNHADQFAEMFPDPVVQARAEVEYFPKADHTFTLLGDRRALIERIERWMRAHFGDK